MWLNPVVDKYRIYIGGDFFNNKMSARYDNYFRHKNAPLKTIEEVVYESINGVNIPGFSLSDNTITGLSNLGDNPQAGVDFPNPTTQMTLPSDTPLIETFDSQILTISMRNNLFNWLYFWEAYRAYFAQDRQINVFPVYITVMDSAEIEIFRFSFQACYVNGMAGLDLNTNNGFRESRTIEAQIRFNGMDVETLIPDFDLKTLNL